MIRETIITTQDSSGQVHIAPMGVHEKGQQFEILPFKPSKTLENIFANRHAVINYTDDVRIFAGCLTGRKQWPVVNTEKIEGKRLTCALAHSELRLNHHIDDDQRPRLICDVVHQATHSPFLGFNRAQFAVLEAAILVSRLHMLPWAKIESELDYLRIGLDKTCGEVEQEAWNWLMETIEQFKQKNPDKVASV